MAPSQPTKSGRPALETPVLLWSSGVGQSKAYKNTPITGLELKDQSPTSLMQGIHVADFCTSTDRVGQRGASYNVVGGIATKRICSPAMVRCTQCTGH